jgi:hypothetical protein
MPSPAPTLDCRLLCASGCTYTISPDGTFDPSASAPFYDAVGYLAPPIPFVAGDDDINACLVGTSGDGVILAFRGTLLPYPVTAAGLLDWLSDFNAAPVSVQGLPGMVHSGFWEDLSSLWEPVLAEVKNQMTANGQHLPLYICGHSKGGALASLAAMYCHTSAEITPMAVYTYASPFTGDLDFALAYNAAIVDVRYEYTDDIAPHLPPSALFADALAMLPVIGSYFKNLTTWDYTSVGTLKFIDWSGQIVGDSIGLEWQRFKSLFGLLMELKFEQIGDDHSHLCGAGYMTYVCPTGVCSP